MLPKSLLPGKNCRGEPRSPAEKRSFSDFPKENNRIFALRRWILLWQNPRATEGRPYGYFFDKLQTGMTNVMLVFSAINYVTSFRASANTGVGIP